MSPKHKSAECFAIRCLALLGLLATAPIVCWARQSHSAATSDLPKSDPCSVAGMVVQLAGTVPIKSATVRLESVEDHTRTFSGVTDAGGRFEVKGVEPGGYRLRVIRNGFVTQEYGQRTPNDPGAILTLRPGRDLKDLLFRLVPSAVIAGRIENEDGDPLPWVRVSALRQTYFRGRRRLASETTVLTNDHGEYRLFGLHPGRYFVSASYKPGQRLDDGSDNSDADAGGLGYVPTYYPGSPDPGKAVALTVKTGEEISSIDLYLEPTTVYSIRGRIDNMVSRQSSGAILVLEPRSAGFAWSNPPQQAVVDKPDGTFEIRGVLRGSYTLTAVWSDQGKQYLARRAVDVGNMDVEGIQLAIAPGMTIPGQVLWDPKPSLERDILMVRASAADSTNSQRSIQMRVAANGTFFLPGMSDGLYRLATFGQTADCYLKSIRYAGMEVSDDEFNVIRGTQATLEVTISAKGARVQGAVTNEDGLPAVGVWVVLVPEGTRRNEFHLFKQITTDQNGRFDVRGIAPGDYKLFSWEQVEPNAWEDPDFLKPFEAKGQSMSVQESEARQVNLVAIRSPSTEPEKQ